MDEGLDCLLRHFAEHAFVQDKPDVIGVAVSGGSDSMAALHLMTRAGAVRGWTVQAVTVDHGLRAGSAGEAQFVAQACTRIGVAHTVLQWRREAATGNLQDQARLGRYRVMTEWAAAQGITDIVLGHTADDQAETFLMGLARGAGIDGLVGMRPRWTLDGVTWVRPFLLQEREDLRGYLTRNAISWVDDPSNADDRFTRVKARRALVALEPLGITVERLAGVISNLKSAQAVVDTAVRVAAGDMVRVAAGAAFLDWKPFRWADLDVQRRLLIAVLRWIGGAAYAPRADAVYRVLMATGAGKDSTLAGCRITLRDGEIRVVREPRAVAGVACATDALWDGRWRLDGPHAPGLEVRALGVGLRACPDWRSVGLSRDVLVVTPGVWRGDVLVAGPLAGLANGWGATVAAGFGLPALSH